jgi:hypothetical protein
MLQVFEASVKGHKIAPLKMVTTLTIQAALSKTLAKELGGDELYRKNETLVEFTNHGFDHDIDAANVSFYPMPGTPAEKSALLHLQNVSVTGFSATKLDGSGASVEFHIVDDGRAVPIVEFLDQVRGWNGRIEVEELQQQLPMGLCRCGAPAEDHVGGTGANPDTQCEKYEPADEAPKGRPKPPAKKGRGAQPRKEEGTVPPLGEPETTGNRKGAKKLAPKKPGGKGGNKSGANRGPGGKKK